jgi:hypothetical protein
MKSINWKANAKLLGLAALVGLLIFVGLALPFYVVGILLTAAIFVLFRVRRVSLPKAISYCSFFLVGTVVTKLQWRISTDATPAAVQELIYPTIAMVGIFGFIGFSIWFSLKKPTDEKLLIAIIVLTIGLPFLALSQFSSWYAGFYVVVCLAAPVVVLAQTWSKPREPHARG